MDSRPEKLIKSMLGQDFFEVLKKSDVYKMNNKVATSIEEMKTGIKIVPRTVMSFLISNLSNLKNDDNKNLELPFAPDCFLQITKKGPDLFTGHIYSKGKKINEFVDTSIPGVGLILMTTFELYNIEKLKETRQEEKEIFEIEKLQKIIDERLRLRSFISKVVDEEISRRDAVEILVKEKLTQALAEKKQPVVEVIENKEETKSEKLKRFLERQKETKKEIEFEKTESISCPDCGVSMYDGGKKMSLCICYGNDWGKEIKIKKNEKNIKMSFPKSMDRQNVELLLENLKIINKE